MPGDSPERLTADFRERLLLLRGRAGLSQRELAALTGASERAIQTWEAGVNHPSADRLKALIALYVQRGVFTPGQERTEVVALWEAARGGASAASPLRSRLVRGAAHQRHNRGGAIRWSR